MKLGDYLTVTEAARFLGVHPETLRRWDWAGKVNIRGEGIQERERPKGVWGYVLQRARPTPR